MYKKNISDVINQKDFIVTVEYECDKETLDDIMNDLLSKDKNLSLRGSLDFNWITDDNIINNELDMNLATKCVKNDKRTPISNNILKYNHFSVNYYEIKLYPGCILLIINTTFGTINTIILRKNLYICGDMDELMNVYKNEYIEDTLLCKITDNDIIEMNNTIKYTLILKMLEATFSLFTPTKFIGTDGIRMVKYRSILYTVIIKEVMFATDINITRTLYKNMHRIKPNNLSFSGKFTLCNFLNFINISTIMEKIYDIVPNKEYHPLILLSENFSLLHENVSIDYIINNGIKTEDGILYDVNMFTSKKGFLSVKTRLLGEIILVCMHINLNGIIVFYDLMNDTFIFKIIQLPNLDISPIYNMILCQEIKEVISTVDVYVYN